MCIPPLSKLQQVILIVLSFVIVAFGQPAWNAALSVIAAIFGFAIFWRVLLSHSERKRRFWMATCWFTAVQLVQLSWLTSHPYLYIYAVYLSLAFVLGIQFGLLALLMNPKQINKMTRIMMIAASWTLMEWVRLFFMSGFSWNPVGLALASNILSIQAASLGGVYGLSFLVILTNLLALRAWLARFSHKISREVGATSCPNFPRGCKKSGLKRYAPKAVVIWIAVAMSPYLFGGIHYQYHKEQMNDYVCGDSSDFSVVLVQTAFPVEESLRFRGRKQLMAYVFNEWRQILKITKQHHNQSINLIVLPEFVVPFGTYTLVYPYEQVKTVFQDIYGPKSLEYFPPLELPLAYVVDTDQGQQWMVNNAFWVQAIANYFDTGVVVGLEDAEDVCNVREYYSSAIYVEPASQREDPHFSARRYSKRVLVPMGEYIPHRWFKELAAHYGVVGSFTCGHTAEVWQCDQVPFGVSICYEETFGEIMRENKQLGAKLLLNLTSDAWFPNSRLARQHLEHARLRTVENGIPLIRACNTGITCAIDSLGRDIAVLGDSNADHETISDSLLVKVPMYTYQTLYGRFGDGLIIGFSLLFALLFLRQK